MSISSDFLSNFTCSDNKSYDKKINLTHIHPAHLSGYRHSSYNALLAVFISGAIRSCSTRSSDTKNGCTTEEHTGAEICVCDTELCNSGVMTSSLGHVIAVVAVLACVITVGYLQLWTSLTQSPWRSSCCWWCWWSFIFSLTYFIRLDISEIKSAV